ncbi:nuclear transport factor 2 family protein [Kordia sp.]|uniref:nuclear transport factor 2 family protein n=1 Tax=Kordia sp. TaxID=1965332 RepID=UPI0025C65E0B|nr:nuclear transport factor 2 family protein [Kordia sp.]MCH2196272.1 nuclear transport factor 2 family protein [Kordia sp.]
MKFKSTLIICALAIVSCNTTEKKKENTTKTNTETKMEKTLTNKEKAVTLLESLETGDQTAVAYINPNKYIQHNLAVADGLEGFGAILQHKPEGGFKANIVRAFEDGDYVFTHTEYDFFGPKVGFDIFRFEDGLIVEHWDNLLETAAPNPSGHTQTDGPTTSFDLDKTAANKALVKDFVATILMNGQFDKLGNYFDGDNYIQHNPAIGDGVSGLGAALEAMAKQGITMVYTKNHIVSGEGNFVLAVSEGTFAGKPTSFYDLFRIENGKIAEHWDVIETIMPEADRKNTNGKFNF